LDEDEQLLLKEEQFSYFKDEEPDKPKL